MLLAFEVAGRVAPFEAWEPARSVWGAFLFSSYWRLAEFEEIAAVGMPRYEF